MDPPDCKGHDDLLRPLTAEGAHKARKLFKTLAKFYDPPELIASSKAVRARQTADLLAEFFPSAARMQTALLNPGADYQSFVRWLRELDKGLERVALVGHEPDLSLMIGGAVAQGHLNIAVKKAACIEVDCNRIGRGELTLLLPPWATP
ncbi:MAG: histidine phosphatase family protein [Kiritimatiellaeota bacterium]|nr:histidine phosphatase family protein [Kiritimatiellota bacterium]